jgi:hypothetical protein
MCNVFTTAGSITGTEVLESHVGWSVIVPEFQGHSGIIAFIAGISFSKTIRNYMGPVPKIAAAASASQGATTAQTSQKSTACPSYPLLLLR